MFTGPCYDSKPVCADMLVLVNHLPQECKRSSVTYISPEHILLALLSSAQPDSVAVKVLER